MEKVLKLVKVSEIVEYERNNKVHGQNIDEIVKSIQAIGYVAPIVVDENMVILAGHGRKKALEKIGNDKVQVLVVTGLTEEQKRDYREDLKIDWLTSLFDWLFDTDDDMSDLDWVNRENPFSIKITAKSKKDLDLFLEEIKVNIEKYWMLYSLSWWEL